MEQQVKRKDRTPVVLLSACLLLTAVYLWRPDGMAALTIWPFWVFAALGILPVFFKLKKERLKRRIVAVGAWALAWFIVGDEPFALVRGVFSGASPHSLRVVSLNCAGGLYEVAHEVVAEKPDIVLFQESPNKVELERVLNELGSDWSLMSGVDGSILVRGQLQPLAMPKMSSNFSAAWAQMPGFAELVFIVSLRLQPPIFRLDYWNPECWTALAANKAARRKELAEIARFVAQESKGAPIILGGDFNTPPDHTVTGSLDTLCRDSFRDAGQGWGATAINDYPMVRIDQIWTSSHFKAVRVFAKKTEFSDHRMAVAEFGLAPFGLVQPRRQAGE